MGKVKKSSSKQTPLEISPSLQSHPTREELYAMGKSLRDKCPRPDHAVWQASGKRPEPLAFADFAIANAEQSDRHHDLLVKAVRAGKLEVFIEQE